MELTNHHGGALQTGAARGWVLLARCSRVVACVASACTLTLLGACSNATEVEPWIELGTGEAEFSSLSDEQEVRLVAGVQGGWHVWTSVQADGLWPEGVIVELESEPVNGSMPLEISRFRVNLDRNEETGLEELIGWPAIQPEPGCIMDHALRLRMTLTDTRGRTASDERIVMPRPGAFPPPPCER